VEIRGEEVKMRYGRCDADVMNSLDIVIICYEV
jgi:hypothetical protein